jgi:hypothetical protein
MVEDWRGALVPSCYPRQPRCRYLTFGSGRWGPTDLPADVWRVCAMGVGVTGSTGVSEASSPGPNPGFPAKVEREDPTRDTRDTSVMRGQRDSASFTSDLPSPAQVGKIWQSRHVEVVVFCEFESHSGHVAGLGDPPHIMNRGAGPCSI